MRLGIKLDLGFSDDVIYRQLFGKRDILGYLVELGVQTVETAITPETEERVLLTHTRRCCEAGLRLSLHPYTEGTRFNPTYFSKAGDNPSRDTHEQFLNLASEIASIQGEEVIVNLHSAAASKDVARWRLVYKSVRLFEWAQEMCVCHTSGARVVAELQYSPDPEERIQRIGDNFGELLFICTRSGVDACWDFGHAYMNWHRYGLAAKPPEAYWKNVTHVHCHDVFLGDHFPLIYHRVPWGEYLSGLFKCGFNGAVIIEVPPECFIIAGGLETVQKSVEELLALPEMRNAD
ncbi:MAG: sugar phosphate isomerase/epimerase [Candidatus Latescibacterota bacterium]|nr:MAG: sugar phosphate isomerase/epimerase [Candidatus Latescibacterota bacterium]